VTHTLQPLEVCMLKPLSQAHSNELSTFVERSQGLLSVKKGDFFPLFWKAWVSSFKEDMIINSFKATGISPLNPDVITYSRGSSIPTQIGRGHERVQLLCSVGLIGGGLSG
jgi:hypothetical protein